MSQHIARNTTLVICVVTVIACTAWLSADRAASRHYSQIHPEQRIYIADANNGAARLQVSLEQRRNLAQVLERIH